MKKHHTTSILLATDDYNIYQTTTPLDASQLNDAQRKKLEPLKSETARHHALLGFQLKNSVPEALQKSRCVSLSHSENIAVMAVHQDESQCTGVDIEAVHRPINPKLRAKLAPSLEEAQLVEEHTSLALWSVKEALWKAWQDNQTGLIKDVTITHVESSSSNKQVIFQGKAQAPCGQVFDWHLYELDSLKLDGTPFYLAVAFTHP
ncbi:MAG: 4'-phosphopantetheinyl transferase superfamily protein [Vampirovibrionales bacterium]